MQAFPNALSLRGLEREPRRSNIADIRNNPILLISSPPTYNMALCSVCRAIEFPSLPLFTGFNRMQDAKSDPPVGQPHHQFQALRESAPSCSLCALLFERFMKSATFQPRGLIELGPDHTRKLHSIPRDEDLVMLLALRRNCWNEKEKHIWGFQALCATLRSNYGLFAAEGLNLPITKLCLLHARAESVKVLPLRSLKLLLGGSLDQLRNVTGL